MVNEAIGVWYEEQRSDLELHLPHLTLVLQDSLQGHKMVSEPESEQASGRVSQSPDSIACQHPVPQPLPLGEK